MMQISTGRAGKVAVYFLVFASVIVTAAAADVMPRPENALMARNFRPGGENPYDFALDAAVARELAPAGDGVRVTFADGHQLVVRGSGEVAPDVLRNGQEEVGDGSDLYRDVIAGAFLAEASPESCNRAIREIEAYPDFFQSDKDAYSHTWYTDAKFLDLGKHAEQAESMNAGRLEVTAELEKLGYLCADPESNLIELALVIGKKNLLVKSKAKPALMTTCYRVHLPAGGDTTDATGELVAILNENSLAWPDEVGGARKQNVVWVIEPVEGGKTLVRYVYACEQHKPEAAMVRKDRWEMSVKNVEEYLRGIRLLAIQRDQEERKE